MSHISPLHFPGVRLKVLWFSWRFLSRFELIFWSFKCPKKESLQICKLRWTPNLLEGNSERHLREELSHLQFFSSIISHLMTSESKKDDLKPSKLVKILSLENSFFYTLDELLQTHFVSKFRFQALKGYFMVFSTDINFFTTFYHFKNWFGQSSFGPILKLEAFLRRKKIVLNGCLPRNCSKTGFSNLQRPKKTKIYWFALKPPKLPEGPLWASSSRRVLSHHLVR